jgi:hypothetical protein
MTATRRAIDWTEQGLMPDSVIRHGIRRLLKAQLQSLPDDPGAQQIPPAEMEHLVTIVAAQDYDTVKLRTVPQQWRNPPNPKGVTP